jgi:hypothetical protein
MIQEMMSAAGQLKAPPASGSDTPAPAVSSNISTVSPVFKQPGLSQSEVDGARQAWIAAGLDPARFDEARGKDGFAAPQADTTPTGLQLGADIGRREVAKPGDYDPELKGDPNATAVLRSDLLQAAADMQLPPTIGRSVIERVVQVAQEFKGMDEMAKLSWLDQQTQNLLRTLPGDHAARSKALASLREDAGKTLAMIKGPLGDMVRGTNAVLNDVWLLKTLATHYRSK